MIKKFIKENIEDCTDTSGIIDILELIKRVQKEFSCSHKHAEEYVYEVLEADYGA